MIVITGATGQLGRGITEHLLTLLPAEEVGISVRNPEKAVDLAERGVRVRRGDFSAPETLSEAFDGAQVLVVVSSNAAATGGDPIAQHSAAIDAARQAGVERVVYTSHMGASDVSAFPPCRDHATTEDLLARSGLAWTSLRHGFYASTAAMVLGDAAKTGVLRAPADGPVAWTTTADLAVGDAEIAALLYQGADRGTGAAGLAGKYDGPTAPLTSHAADDASALARIASGLLGREITHEVIDDEAMTNRWESAGMPSAAATFALGIFRAARDGDFATTDPLLGELLGRTPTPVRDVLAGTIKTSA